MAIASEHYRTSANEGRLATLESGIKSFRQWHCSANEIESKSSSRIESFRIVRQQRKHFGNVIALEGHIVPHMIYSMRIGRGTENRDRCAEYTCVRGRNANSLEMRWREKRGRKDRSDWDRKSKVDRIKGEKCAALTLRRQAFGAEGK